MSAARRPARAKKTAKRGSAARPAAKRAAARATVAKPARRAAPADGLYPQLRTYRTGRLRVSPVHELYFEESGNRDFIGRVQNRRLRAPCPHGRHGKPKRGKPVRIRLFKMEAGDRRQIKRRGA